MSSHVDTVVIGGGLLGCATAWMLAQEGGSILLAERDQINQHASGQNAGSLHFQLEYRMMEHGVEAAKKAAEAMPLHLEAAELWQGIADASGEEIEVTQTGGLMLAESAKQARILERKVAIEQGWGLDVRMLDQREVQSVAPYLTENIVAAAFCPVEGKADTRTAGPALARAAIREGASVETRTEVVNIRRDGRRWRLTLRTDAGERDVFSDAVVIAAGVWTTEIGKLIGVDLPTIAVALQMTVSLKVPKFIDHLVQHAGERLSLKQSLDGNVLIGGGWPAKLPHTAGGAPDFSKKPKLLQSSLAGNARVASRVVPQVAEIPMLRSWSGVTTVTPDQLPLVGPVPNAPGVFVATGGSAFTLGPSFARVLTELVAGKTPTTDLSSFDPMRYGKGDV
ncbi:FAD-dependent oxidoreductase [Pseudoglutamicibacter cumminsii]|uniref:NAD(P)/FAD-dependent oxidoreductase n=1 Tax=Pseudoglutamicibacter cumminsii TaxID=156979 RepID=UPI002557309A|nr:FAD-dependent oxidoreductase [Pseudoglutamicibacter cumminsii]MDZ3744857.1 FAD-dependent oxidoreductase [Pseudoglutamicibacter cumminsii]